MSSLWGKVLHNSLNDAKGLVDPRSYVPIAKAALAFQTGNPRPAFNLAKSIGKSYVDLAKHPIRELENHPINTTLSVLPVAGGLGKLADVGAEAGASRAMATAGGSRQAALAKLLSQQGRTPGLRAVKATGSVVKDARERLAAIPKHNDGSAYDIPRNPDMGGVPGATFDRSVLNKMVSDLGLKNSGFGLDYQPKKLAGIRGTYGWKNQMASGFVEKNHLGGHGPRAFAYDPANAADDLTQTVMHEARHAYQHQEWPRRKLLVDTYRKYGNRHVEQDANAFMTNPANVEKYKGLVKVDPQAKGIPPSMMPFQRNPMPELYDLIHKFETGQEGVTESHVSDYLSQLVGSGHLQPQEAMDLADEAGVAFRKGSYQPPTSQSDLFNRAAKRARGAAHSVAGEHHFAASQKFIPTSGAVPSNASMVDTLRRSI